MRHLPILLALVLGSCEGPWDGLPPGDDSAPSLQVSLLLVGDRDFDTLRVAAPLGFHEMPGRAWLDTARSSLVLRRLDAPDSMVYRPVSPVSGSWAPVRAARVPRGSNWSLDLHAWWSDADGVARESRVTGTARVPLLGALGRNVLAPAWVRSPTYASGSEAGQELSPSARDSLVRGLCPWIALREGDTVWYPHAETGLPDPEGRRLPLPLLPFRLPLVRDPSLWDGVWVDLRFDSARSRVLDYRLRRLYPDQDPPLDSLHYPGSHRVVDQFPRSDDVAGWPDELRIETGAVDVTGEVALRVWFPEPGVFDWWESQSSAEASNSLDRSTLQGARGWFAGAVVDSIVLHVRASRDTVPLPEAHRAWCREHGC